MDYSKEMKDIFDQIAAFEKAGKNPAYLYKKQIGILEKAHEDLINNAKAQGYDINSNLHILELEIKQFTAMKQLAAKVNFPTDKYDRMIREARVRVLGEEFVAQHFDNRLV